MQKEKLESACLDSERLEKYLEAKAFNHNCYKTYTTSERVTSWIDKDCFYLSDGSDWNDTVDRNTFNHESYPVKRFIKGETTDTSEFLYRLMIYADEQICCVPQDVETDFSSLSDDEKEGYRFALEIIKCYKEYYEPLQSFNT